MSTTTRRIVYGLVAATLVATGVLLVVFLGLGVADELSSVIGMIAGVGSMLLAIVALRQAGRSPANGGTSLTTGDIIDSTFVNNPTGPLSFTTNYNTENSP